MNFTSDKNTDTKAIRARTLALAAAILLLKAGERVGMADAAAPPRTGQIQMMRLAQLLSDMTSEHDFGAPNTQGIGPNARAVFVSDFMGDMTQVKRSLAHAADRGVQGVLLQVLDTQEETFPFDGRTVFESMGRSLRHETQKAGDLRDRYLMRLAERKAELAQMAAASGWQFKTHHTDTLAQAALLWLYTALERG